MSENFLNAYVQRIGYTGDLQPTYTTCQALHRLHVQTFPFENINNMLRWPVPLDIESLQNKMVDEGRGGYCFEQNLLFQHALQAVGFPVKGLAARVLSNPSPERMPARTHMLLLVDVNGEHHIADTGFGGMTLAEPIRLRADVVQPTSHEARRLLKDDDDYIMQAQVDNEWRTLYQFNLVENHLADYEVSNWWICTHPNSHFTQRLSMARVFPEGRYTLRHNELATHVTGGTTDRRPVTSVQELRDALQDLFLLRLPDDDELNRVLNDVIEASV